MKINFLKIKGFTLIELLVSVGIFAIMTALLMARYGSFDQGVLLTNLAYDVALTIRTAQSYGLNVKSYTRDLNNFDAAYGVHFVATSTGFIFFADTSLPIDYIYQITDVTVSSTTIKRNSKVGTLCIGSGPASCVAAKSIDISFNRPDPNAHINGMPLVAGNPTTGTYAEIILMSSDGTIRKVIVRSTGQISVE